MYPLIIYLILNDNVHKTKLLKTICLFHIENNKF